MNRSLGKFSASSSSLRVFFKISLCDKITRLSRAYIVHIGFRWLAVRSKAIATLCPLIITAAEKEGRWGTRCPNWLNFRSSGFQFQFFFFFLFFRSNIVRWPSRTFAYDAAIWYVNSLRSDRDNFPNRNVKSRMTTERQILISLTEPTGT